MPTLPETSEPAAIPDTAAPPETAVPASTAAPPARPESPAAPDPMRLYPDVHGPRSGRAQVQQVVFLKPLVQHPLTSVGEYTYYVDPADPTGFERNNVLFHYGPERLVIGRFCALARGVRFIMNAANHAMGGASTFPFPIFGDGWLRHMDVLDRREAGRDTVLGNDVWLGTGVTIMPGVTIGDGAIVAAMSVVASDIPPYAVAAGNPARVVRRRFDDEEIETLLRIAWWEWPIEVISEYAPVIMTGSAAELAAVAREHGLPAAAPPVTRGTTTA